MSWIAFTAGLLLGWLTAFSLMCLGLRTFVAQLQASNERHHLSPLWRMAKQRGSEMVVTVKAGSKINEGGCGVVVEDE